MWMLLSLAQAAPNPLNGHHVLSTDPAVITAVQQQEISNALSGIPSIFHSIATTLLAPTLIYCQEYTLDISSTWFSLTCDQHTPISRPLNNSEIMIPWGDKQLKSKVALVGDDAILSLASDEGTRITHLHPTAQGIQAKVEIQSPKLSYVLHWTLDYLRH